MDTIKDGMKQIQLSIDNIECSRTRSDYRKNQSLLKIWNNVFKYLEDTADDEWTAAIALMYYGALSERHSKMLNWQQFSELAKMILRGGRLL